jgi:hypothetical protein
LWGANLGGFTGTHPLSIFQIDPATGTVGERITIHDSHSRTGVLDFASDPFRNSATVWSLHNTELNGYELLSFNPYEQKLLNNVPIDDSLALQGLAIDPTTGHFYATSSTALYQLDPITGHADLIGPTSSRADAALGFDLDGRLFGNFGRTLVSVNKLTGETSIIANIDARPADIAVRAEDGLMYGLGFGNDPNVDYSLYQIDTATGNVTNIGPSVGRPAGLAFTRVPEPATPGLIVVAWMGVLALFSPSRPVY